MKSLTGFIFFLVAWTACANPLPARPFLHPDRIRYDGQCMTIDGKDVFIYSGAFHYFRCPKELWGDRFRKIKDAGFNTVETYVPWNWHEQTMPAGLDDFSKVDLTDLDDWLALAEQFGLYVILRPGPYICAEWDTGGFPQWLLDKKPGQPLREKCWLRSDDPVYLAWCKHWYDAVCPVIARHQITRHAPGRPGVILVQVENEYDYAGLPADVMLNQVKALMRDARARGVDVPFISCWTHPVRGQADPLLRQVFDACNFYPRWDVDGIAQDIQKLRREQPDAPLATLELQGGWFSEVGGKLSEEQDGLTAAQINNLTLFAIQNGDTILNYYMLCGGSNPGDWGARNLTTSYDYDAPIREWGGIDDRYQRIWALGHFLREHGARLARSRAVACMVSGAQSDVMVAMRRAPDGGRYLFVRTSQHTERREGVARVRETAPASEITFAYSLEPFGSQVLYLPPGIQDAARGQWLPEPPPRLDLSDDPPASVAITSAWRRDDPGPSHWTALRSGQTLAQIGVDDSRFVYYGAKISRPAMTNLQVEFPAGDVVLAAINGKKMSPAACGTGDVTLALSDGVNQVEMLYENRGHANGGQAIEQPSGILAARLVKTAFGAGKPVPGWRMRKIGGVGNVPETAADFCDDNWPAVNVEKIDANDLGPGENAVFRAQVQLTKADLAERKKILSFGRIDDLGWVYVNGTNVGEATDWSQPCSFDVTRQLHEGRNSVAVVVQNNAGSGGIGAPLLADRAECLPVASLNYGNPRGIEDQWWKTQLDETSWTPVTLPDSESQASARPASLLTWYRLKFGFKSEPARLRVPWRLHLEATGNGFVYVNGHALGRYWQAGPQCDFFLPECWLDFGPENANIITVSLRNSGKGAAILSATIEPYSLDRIKSPDGTKSAETSKLTKRFLQ